LRSGIAKVGDGSGKNSGSAWKDQDAQEEGVNWAFLKIIAIIKPY
jgi:hypothetical protein